MQHFFFNIQVHRAQEIADKNKLCIFEQERQDQSGYKPLKGNNLLQIFLFSLSHTKLPATHETTYLLRRARPFNAPCFKTDRFRIHVVLLSFHLLKHSLELPFLAE